MRASSARLALVNPNPCEASPIPLSDDPARNRTTIQLPRGDTCTANVSTESIVIDVRPPEEYRAGHIRGALSLPLDELERRVRELPARKEIVAYCRGPYCLMAYHAVEKLRARGRRARRLAEGLPEWRAAGLPIETSA